MAESTNGVSAPSMNDVEMKEEMAEQSVHSIPSAPEQVAGTVQDDQTATAPVDEKEALPTDQSITARVQLQESTPTSMEGILNGGSVAPIGQVPPPPVAQAPSASPLPATASATIAPPTASLPASAPTPPPAPPTRPSSIPPAVSLPPEKPHAHGSPTRVYLNQAVTPHLLEGMKYLAAYEPEKPLKWLSEFLAKRSMETEGES
ncbi:hypothetical protein AUEXF2481DRAFT_90973 [Aureobasidium subglaciale EXF-2481]|uniref:Dpy-30 domain-containing protein n=1 Tax=Aureobasidium subglaciale (strain EXF-2481) TaxID=1043005 RepID=A0A074YFS9_AURSE|nr:uncharacterized protein AUEXF2481DRAFT_90973 [Aureobasidium subglaciale EXF-2481]KAI5218631.1 hypothetical protein E4T41_08252 [Aureobasidium subglaciale]KAI5256209.1 hypothetical protein E4T46_08287 [Aureobasidium subglaciale]KEQ92947.1 hypothetical protein AUEXF2481DRAFT_90973 [Aureobasidium subglaciale EXF-2481]